MFSSLHRPDDATDDDLFPSRSPVAFSSSAIPFLQLPVIVAEIHSFLPTISDILSLACISVPTLSILLSLDDRVKLALQHTPGPVSKLFPTIHRSGLLALLENASSCIMYSVSTCVSSAEQRDNGSEKELRLDCSSPDLSAHRLFWTSVETHSTWHCQYQDSGRTETRVVAERVSMFRFRVIESHRRLQSKFLQSQSTDDEGVGQPPPLPAHEVGKMAELSFEWVKSNFEKIVVPKKKGRRVRRRKKKRGVVLVSECEIPRGEFLAKVQLRFLDEDSSSPSDAMAARIPMSQLMLFGTPSGPFSDMAELIGPPDKFILGFVDSVEEHDGILGHIPPTRKIQRMTEDSMII